MSEMTKRMQALTALMHAFKLRAASVSVYEIGASDVQVDCREELEVWAAALNMSIVARQLETAYHSEATGVVNADDSQSAHVVRVWMRTSQNVWGVHFLQANYWIKVKPESLLSTDQES